MNGCRIGRVRLKSGGVIEVPRFKTDGEAPFAADLRQHVNQILNWWGSAMTGYYLVVWDERGEMTTASRFDPKQIAPHLLPAFIAEVVRDRTVCEQAVREVNEGHRGG